MRGLDGYCRTAAVCAMQNLAAGALADGTTSQAFVLAWLAKTNWPDDRPLPPGMLDLYNADLPAAELAGRIVAAATRKAGLVEPSAEPIDRSLDEWGRTIEATIALRSGNWN